MKEIKYLDTQSKSIENKIASIRVQIDQVDNDIMNLESNKQIEDEIASNKKKRSKYEERIEHNEKLICDLRNQNELIAKYEDMEKEKNALEHELDDLQTALEKFDTYKTQIEENNKMQGELNSLKAELADFEEVIIEVEKQFNIENTNLTKSIALLDQIRKDIAENRSIENNLTLFTIYKKSLKQLPYMLLAKIQPLLEKKVNDLLSMIADFTLKFDIADKIDIYIERSSYHDRQTVGKTRSSVYNSGQNERHILVNNGSGFEKFISGLAIRLALVQISNLPKINFLAIDEGWSCFDNTNLNNVGQILDYLKTKFDFILTISHLTEIKQHCDTMISLRKDDNGFSKIIY